MAEFIYTMRKARKAHGDKVILDDVTLSFLPGAKIGVVGPNGAGKSSVLQDHGRARPAVQRRGARSSPGYTVGILAAGAAARRGQDRARERRGGASPRSRRKLDRFNEIAEQMATDYTDALMDEMGKLQEELDHADAWDLDAQLEQAMDALRCPPPRRRRHRASPVVSAAGSRCASCCSRQPDLLLLDEPTNHLDAESVQWLEQHLAKYAGHRRRRHPRPVLPGQRRRSGSSSSTAAGPTPTRATTRPTWRPRQTRLKVEGRKDAKRQKRLEDELEWVRSNAKARQAKSKARLERYEEMAAEAEKTRKLDFEEIQIPPGPRLGNVVVEVDDLTKGFDDRVLIDDLSFTLPRNGIVGVIGPNGVGKTTLFKMIVGEEKPDAGDDQGRRDGQDLLRRPEPRRHRPEEDASGRSSPTGSTTSRSATSRCRRGPTSSAFGFKGPDQQKPAGVLSGGERNRLNLALTLKMGGNLLLLDEPTNDLDVETLSSRWRTRCWSSPAAPWSSPTTGGSSTGSPRTSWPGRATRSGKWFWFEGNFESYEKNKVERLGAEAARPHRVTYRKLTRD